MSSKILFGALFVAFVMVVPSLGLGFIKGPICRFVQRSTEAVINQTTCPFSDMDPPPFLCVNSSQTSSGNGGSRFPGFGGFGGFGNDDEDEDDDGFGRWFNFRPRRDPPPTRKDHCKLQLSTSCQTDADCVAYPGLMKSRCVGSRWTGSFCVPDVSSVAISVLASRPCEIRRQGGAVTYTDLEQCRSQKSLLDLDFGGMNPFSNRGGSPPPAPRVCESSPSLTARINGVTYEIKTCVPPPNSNNNNNNGGNP